MSVARENLGAPEQPGRPQDGRPAMSIGEVLAQLKEEFSDVSVSKIRFLESEGLITPERTASGYRKFATRDVERLRLILRLQRDSFLPLRVIKQRLADLDAGKPVDLTAAPRDEPEPVHAPAAPPAAPPAPAEPADDLSRRLDGARLTAADLAREARLDAKQIKALQEFGVVCSHDGPTGPYFDEEDLEVARIARDLLELGIDARNLRVLRRIAEQEATMYEQVVFPATRNRNPEARARATETLLRLGKLGRALRASYLRQSLRSLLGEDR